MFPGGTTPHCSVSGPHHCCRKRMASLAIVGAAGWFSSGGEGYSAGRYGGLFADGAGCDRVIRFDPPSDWMQGGVFFSRCLFSAMAPELVFPSPPSDLGLARRARRSSAMKLLEPWRRGDRTTSPLLQLVWVGFGARWSSRRCPSWARCARPFPRLLHPQCA